MTKRKSPSTTAGPKFAREIDIRRETAHLVLPTPRYIVRREMLAFLDKQEALALAAVRERFDAIRARVREIR